MKSIEKDIETKEGLVALHLLGDNYIINFSKKLVQSTVNSFKDGKIENNFENGQIRIIKISEFQILYNDITKIEEEIENYFHENINSIII